MCGIFSIINNEEEQESIKNAFNKGKSRGPEYSKIVNINNVTLGFHRLAINGYDKENPKVMENSNQPFHLNNCWLVCNGEIYNWEKLQSFISSDKISCRSDCDIILHLYVRFGIEQTLQMLDGVFSFIIIDNRVLGQEKIFVARDTYGVRPLFYTYTNGHQFMFASEMKQLIDICDDFEILQFQPGTYDEYIKDPRNNYHRFKQNKPFSMPNSFTDYSIETENDALTRIRISLIKAVEKRVNNTDRPICCLLSGGLDSSLIAALVKRCSKNQLHTWSIGLKGSEDLRYAKLVSDHIGSIHHSYELEESEFLEAIDDVIYNIESYDTTTVRASVGNWLISKKIKENSDAKVVFNGDGSDELTGGYLYFYKAENNIAFDKECRRLLSDIHYFDVLRSDRSISSHGLEARTPFLDRGFIQTYLSIPSNIRFHVENKKCEKYLLRKAFDGYNLLPDEVLWRTKEAFSDGVSKQNISWYEIIQEYINKFYLNKSNEMQTVNYDKYKDNNPPTTLEQFYYREIFEKYYPNQEKSIPYFWMPKFVEANDASARTLDIYKNLNNVSEDKNDVENNSNDYLFSGFALGC